MKWLTVNSRVKHMVIWYKSNIWIKLKKKTKKNKFQVLRAVQRVFCTVELNISKIFITHTWAHQQEVHHSLEHSSNHMQKLNLFLFLSKIFFLFFTQNMKRAHTSSSTVSTSHTTILNNWNIFSINQFFTVLYSLVYRSAPAKKGNSMF